MKLSNLQSTIAFALYVLFVPFLAHSQTTKIINPGSLVAYYTFEEGAIGSNANVGTFSSGSASIILDQSGHANNGSIACNAAGQVQWVQGKFGRGLSINTDVNNGASLEYNQVYLPTGSNVQTGAFTVTGWLYQFAPYTNVTGLTTPIQPIWSHDYSLGSTFCAILSVQTNGAGNVQLFDGAHNPSVVGSPISNVSAWHHYAATYDGSSTLRLYQDGKLSNSGTSASFNNISQTAPGHLGLWNNIGRNGLYGILDDVRLYNRALNDAEIADMVLAKKGKSK